MSAGLADVRAITVRQPWAWAIAHGGKNVENRSQGTRYRGTLLIHAGRTWSPHGATDSRVRAAYDDLYLPAAWLALGAPTFPPGVVVAVAQLVDVHPDADCCRPWGESSYPEGRGKTRTAVHHLVLEDVVPLLEPVPSQGALGLWRPDRDLVRATGADIAAAITGRQAGGSHP